MDERSPARDPAQVAVIHNPAAGRRGARRLRRAVERLRGAGLEVAVRATEAAGDAERLAREASASGAGAVVVAGGDGTLREAVNGLGPESPPLGVVPLGTSNVFASEIGIPTSPEGAAQVVAARRTRRIRLGEVDGRRFLQMAGVGVDSRAVARVGDDAKRRLGRWAYVLGALRGLAGPGHPVLEGTLDGAPFATRSLVACNGRLYGGRFVLAPGADPARASLEAVLLDRPGARSALRHGAALLRGRVAEFPGVRVVTASRICVDRPEGEPVQADGDIVAQTPVVIRSSEAEIDVLAPPERADGAREVARGGAIG